VATKPDNINLWQGEDVDLNITIDFMGQTLPTIDEAWASLSKDGVTADLELSSTGGGVTVTDAENWVVTLTDDNLSALPAGVYILALKFRDSGGTKREVTGRVFPQKINISASSLSSK